MATDLIAAAPAGIGSPTQAATGAYIASANAASIVCGFNPRYVCFIDETNNVTLEKMQGSAPNKTYKTVAAGTKTIDTTGLLTFPADAGLNEPGSTVLVAAGAFATGAQVVWFVEG